MTAESGSGARSARQRRAAAALSVLGVIVGVLGLVFVVRLLARDWDEVTDALADADGWLVGASLMVGLGGMTWTSVVWHRILAGFGARLPLVRVVHAYFVGQLGKYVPGGLWAVLSRAEIAVRHGAPRAAAYPSVGLSMAVTFLSALLFAGAASPWATTGDGAGRWALLALPVGLVAIHPRVLRVGIAMSERVFAGGGDVVVPSWGATMGLLVRQVPTWVLISSSTWLLAEALGYDVGLATVAFAAPLSWFIGFVAIPVPGGVGVREAAFVGAVGSLGSTEAAAVAIAARLAFVAIDLLGALLATLALVVASRRGRGPDGRRHGPLG